MRPRDILVVFWKRGVSGLFPALAEMIGGFYLFAVFLLQPVELRFLGKHGFAALLGAANVTLWTESGYFDAETARKPLLHLWSLGVEEQFYFFWPLLVLLATFCHPPSVRFPPLYLGFHPRAPNSFHFVSLWNSAWQFRQLPSFLQPPAPGSC